MNELAPIILFVYNRPWHTLQTLEALSKNNLADKSKLIIYCDGPKADALQEDLIKIEEVKKTIRLNNWCASIEIIESSENKGLAKSIIEGVTETVNNYGKVIVLEDDIVTSTGFLKYMNDALNMYEKTQEVMHISGYMYPVKEKLPETFFIKPTSCWGWATWDRAWKFFEKNIEKQITRIEEKNLWNDFTINGSFPSYKNQLELNKNGTINTWAIFWYSSVFLKNGLSLHPTKSLVQNIGFDGSGENCGGKKNQSSPYFCENIAEIITVKKINLTVNKKAYSALFNYFNYIIFKIPNFSFRDKFYLYRQNIKKYALDVKKVILNYKKIDVYEKNKPNQVNNQTKIERYNQGKVFLLDKEFKYVDYPSFESTKIEVFNHEIYKFTSNKSEPTIIDCGSNIGLSILYFKKLFPKAKIIGFEPDPEIFSVLNENIINYNLSDVKTFNYALWNEEGEISFFSEGADGGRIDDKSYGNGKLITLKTKTLSPFINTEIDFLKIDIEGAETKVLKECEDKLYLVDKIFIEYHSMIGQEQTLDEILNILTKGGFRYYISKVGVNSSHPFMKKNISLGMDNQLNIFAFRDNN